MSISKVAKLAGVSSSTVSRVINNHPRIAPATAQAVRKAMQTLSYTPSERRPGPKPSFRSRSGVASIAFLVLGTSRTRATPAFEELLRGTSMAASKDDLNLIFNHVSDPDHLPGRILDQRIDGLLLHGAAPGPELRDRLRRLPTVWLMGNRRRPDWGDQVLPDAYEIGELAARYLSERGHERVAFLNLDGGHWSLRMYGHMFAAAAGEGGEAGEGGRKLHVDRVEIARPPLAPSPSAGYWREHTMEAVEALVQRFLALEPRPTGLFVADDMQVAMIQPALQKHGVEIGPGGAAGAGKIEIISCNNEEPYLVGLRPQPASIDIRVESIGRRGVEQLLWRLEHPDIPERIITTIEPFVAHSAHQAAGTASSATPAH